MTDIKKNSILIVDDQEIFLESLSYVLGMEYTIYQAQDGLTAINMVYEHLPDIVLLDVVMPGMSGFEVLEELKKSAAAKDIPVIIISGLNNTEDEEKGLALEAADFVHKPYNIEIIRQKVRNHLQIVNQIRTIRQYTHSLEIHNVKMDAIVNNYKGIIWSIDINGMVTSFNGQYLKVLNIESDYLVGIHFKAALKRIRQSEIIKFIEKTFSEGPQDWRHEIDDKIFQSHSTPIFNNGGSLIGMVGSSDDITEIVTLYKLSAAAEEKSKFFAKMSHEMRTPLNAVIGLSEVILEEGGLSEEAYQNIEKICSAGSSLLHMVNDILDISKIESGSFKIVPVEYHTADMLSDTITQCVLYKGEKPIEFIINLDDKIPLRLFGDDVRIKQIINNLLSNAFKYTREGTVELNVKCVQENNIVWLSVFVKDTGIGISKEDMENTLFFDYSRLDSLKNRKIEGTGLGMPITKKLVDMMEGSISVESEHGKGSVFTVKLPQKFVTAEFIGHEIISTLKSQRYLSRRSGKKQSRRVILPYANVLVVDDVLLNLDVARGMMKPYMIKVDCATSGQQAVDIIREERVKYNAVFMDQMMPVMDGIEAVRIIREEIGTEYAKTIPIIAFTANALTGNEEMFLQCGFQAFLTKPIEPPQLDAAIMRWLRDEEQEKLLEQNKITINGKTFYDTRTGKDRRSGLTDRRKGFDRRLLMDHIEGMDTRKALARFSGNMETFLNVLKSFTTNTGSLLYTLKNVNKGNLADYAVNVHGVKSSCRGISAEEAGSRAEDLEKAAKAGDLAYVAANNDAFIEDVQKLITNIEAVLNKRLMETNRPEKLKKDKPYREALLWLKDACYNYQIDKIEAVMKEIECFEYTADDGFTSWLRKNVDQMNYLEIVNKLNTCE